MLAFKLWIFEFDWSSLFAFLIGIIFGISILGLIYAILVVSSLKSRKYVIKDDKVEVDDEEIVMIIKNAQIAFKDKSIKGAKSTIGHAYDISINLVKDISRKYFPKSKRPFAELSIDEILRLSVYISDRINELIDRPGLRLLKRVKLSTILGLGDAKKVIDESSLMKLTKKYKLKKIFSAVKGALNIVNPLYWVRKAVMNTSLDFAIKKLCQAIIGIVGEETFKIYSKRVFDEEKIIDTGVEDIASSLDSNLEDISDEEIDAYLKNEVIEQKIERKKER